MASESSSSKERFSKGIQASSGPKGPEISFISPKIMSGLSTKYWFILCPLALVFRCTHAGSMSTMRSRFCRKIMSEVTSVPAALLKVSFGKRMAPSRSARCAMYFRTAGFSLSMVPLEVINATIPPGRTLSKVLAKK